MKRANKKVLSRQAERAAICADLAVRIAKCLEVSGLRDKGYNLKLFYLPFFGAKNQNGEVMDLRHIRKIISRLMEGKPHYKDERFVAALEHFCRAARESTKIMNKPVSK